MIYRAYSIAQLLISYSHRLSTITSADQILVLHAGKVAEAGTHLELLAMKGRYANMWKKQSRAERAAEVASQMVAKANALAQAAMDRPGSSGIGGPSEDNSDNEADNRSGTTLAPSLALTRAPDGLGDANSSNSSSQASDISEDDKADDQKDGMVTTARDSDDDQSEDGKPDPAKSDPGEPATRP